MRIYQFHDKIRFYNFDIFLYEKFQILLHFMYMRARMCV